MVSRRGFLKGLVGVIAAPAIVRVESLMKLPVRKIVVPEPFNPLHFGNMSWRPEVIRVLPTVRDNSKELIVQPMMRVVGNLPIMASMFEADVGGIILTRRDRLVANNTDWLAQLLQ